MTDNLNKNTKLQPNLGVGILSAGILFIAYAIGLTVGITYPATFIEIIGVTFVVADLFLWYVLDLRRFSWNVQFSAIMLSLGGILMLIGPEFDFAAFSSCARFVTSNCPVVPPVDMLFWVSFSTIILGAFWIGLIRALLDIDGINTFRNLLFAIFEIFFITLAVVAIFIKENITIVVPTLQPLFWLGFAGALMFVIGFAVWWNGERKLPES